MASTFSTHGVVRGQIRNVFGKGRPLYRVLDVNEKTGLCTLFAIPPNGRAVSNVNIYLTPACVASKPLVVLDEEN